MATPRDLSKLKDILATDPVALTKAELEELSVIMDRFDKSFLGERWDAADWLLRESPQLEHTFDHQFRRMLHSIYTANQSDLDASLSRLHAVYGEQIVNHIYKGYCATHRIPNRLSASS